MCREKDLSLPLMTPFPAPPTCARSTPWLPLATDVGWVSAPCLTLTGTTGASLCSRCGSRASTFLPPVPRRSFALCASRGSSPLRYHEGSDSCTAHPPCRSPRLLRHTFLSFHLQPRGLPGHRFSHHASVTSDFRASLMESQAHRSFPPNRVRYPTDRQFASGCLPPRLTATQLPSATEFVAYSDTDFHRADVAPSRAHDARVCGKDGLSVRLKQRNFNHGRESH